MQEHLGSDVPARFVLQGKVAFITGGNRGIGKAIALSMANAGADIVITGRDEASAAATLEQVRAFGRRCEFIACDLRDDDAVGQLVGRAIAVFGSLDILVNNAGIGPEKPALDITLAEWRATQSIILEVPFRLAQDAARHFFPRGGGAIINISSVRGQIAGAEEAHYVAAKHGLNGLTKALAFEWAGRGIRVNAIAPGLIMTDMTAFLKGPDFEQRFARYPVGRAGYPRDIGGVAVFLASEAADFVHGQIITVDGGRTTG